MSILKKIILLMAAFFLFLPPAYSTEGVTDTFTPTPTNTFTSTPTYTPTPTPPPSFLIRPWTVGQKMAIKVSDYKNDVLSQAQTITYSIVDQEVVNGNTLLWLEIQWDKDNGTSMVRKLEVRQPQDIDFENILKGNFSLLTARRVIQVTQVGPVPVISPVPTPTRIPYEFEQAVEAVTMVESGPVPFETEDYSAVFQTSLAAVTVLAGSFNTTKFYYTLSTDNSIAEQFMEDYGSPLVPIWGFVKRKYQRVDTDSTVIRKETELVSYSDSGAESKINGRPYFLTLSQQQENLDRAVSLLNLGN